MTETSLHLSVAGDVATVRLTRPEVRNALDETLIGNLAQAFQKLSVAEAVRVVVLEGEGDAFCAGADLGWLKRTAEFTPDEARRDAMQLAVMLDAIDRCAKPVVAVVQGPALGAGMALVAAADVAIAEEGASFSISAVRLGLNPAVVAPYVTQAIGVRACRRYLLTGERFDAREALRLGLVHAVVAPGRLAEARDRMIAAMRWGAPKAQAATKDMLRVVADTPNGPDLMRWTTSCLADNRGNDEAREGVGAMLEKRRPSWAPPE